MSVQNRTPRRRQVLSRDATFQQWQALLDNRTKRNQLGEFVVHGVRPISLAVEHDWPLRALLRPAGASLSQWASEIVAKVGREHVVEMAPDLLGELGDKSDEAPELLAIARIPPDRMDRIAFADDGLAMVLDRPASPGNLGTSIRSADAFGVSGVVVTGHATDVYDPRTVRASTGSLFGVPVVRTPSHREVLDWAAGVRAAGTPVRLVGADEDGPVDIDDADLTGPCVLVVGNEHRGMTAAWRDACDLVVRIPITGSASSLNASVAASLLCYEARRQRRRSPRR
jgi:23S rRNA (uridine2479-2'-O)-methyltransferase